MFAKRTEVLRLLAVCVLGVSASVAQAAENSGCGATTDPKLKGAALSERLAKCNGVLKPSGAADGDIIIPAPKIDDPAVVHPKDLHQDHKGTAK